MMGFGNPLFDGDRREGKKALEPTKAGAAPYEQKLKFLSLWAGNAAAPPLEELEPTREARREESPRR